MQCEAARPAWSDHQAARSDLASPSAHCQRHVAVTPVLPIGLITIFGNAVRLYQNPVVSYGRPWCALADVAAVVGYPDDVCPKIERAWQYTRPDLAALSSDGAVVVSAPVVFAFLFWLEAMGCHHAPAVRVDYDVQTIKAFIKIGAHLPPAEWLQLVQRSALADALTDADGWMN